MYNNFIYFFLFVHVQQFYLCATPTKGKKSSAEEGSPRGNISQVKKKEGIE